MSLNYGYWPRGHLPSGASGNCGPMFSKGSIVLPSRFQGVGSANYCDQNVIGGDDFARAALETYRDSYHTMPTGGVREFVSFFSRRNFEYLAAEIKKRSGGFDIDKNELMDAMMTAYTFILPRSDPTDIERRTDYTTKGVTESYVAEMNKVVFDRTVEEVKQANKLWCFLAKNRNGPSEFPEHLEIDDRTRNSCSFYDFSYWMPDD